MELKPAREADKLTAIREPNVLTMSGPQHVTISSLTLYFVGYRVLSSFNRKESSDDIRNSYTQ